MKLSSAPLQVCRGIYIANVKVIASFSAVILFRRISQLLRQSQKSGKPT